MDQHNRWHIFIHVIDSRLTRASRPGRPPNYKNGSRIIHNGIPHVMLTMESQISLNLRASAMQEGIIAGTEEDRLAATMPVALSALSFAANNPEDYTAFVNAGGYATPDMDAIGAHDDAITAAWIIAGILGIPQGDPPVTERR
jgi:hypothetical protein